MPGGVLGQAKIVDYEASIAIQVTHLRSSDDHAGGAKSQGSLDRLHCCHYVTPFELKSRARRDSRLCELKRTASAPALDSNGRVFLLMLTQDRRDGDAGQRSTSPARSREPLFCSTRVVTRRRDRSWLAGGIFSKLSRFRARTREMRAGLRPVPRLKRRIASRAALIRGFRTPTEIKENTPAAYRLNPAP